MRNNLQHLVFLLNAVSGIKDLTLTTNGYLLEQQAEALKKSGLSRITVSLDTLDDELFKTMNGGDSTPKGFLQELNRLVGPGLSPIKINSFGQKDVKTTHCRPGRHLKGKPGE
ncbi:MAG: hypothetical protein CM1200mP15_12920 [Dehalococcoidia bacterium]|nr:MAG: hypothetical protein CM1200mP15_12920 [Dehalococcoidia bacterium]